MRPNITVLIKTLAREKILAFAEAVTTEIGGLMSVHQEGHTLIVEDAWTVPQEVSAGGVYFEVGHFEDHIKAMGWPNGRPMPHICMGTWHSHVNGQVFWSAVDEADISRKYAMRGFLVNVVVNQKGDWLSQVDTMVGPENGKPSDYILVTVPSTLKLVNVRDTAILTQVNAEITTNVRERKYEGVIFPGHGDYKDWPWVGDYREPKEPKQPKNNRRLFANARERTASHDGSLMAGVWSINKRTKCMEKWQGGKCIAIITKMGDGELTLYDDDGKVLATDRHFGRKGWLPPADL